MSTTLAAGTATSGAALSSDTSGILQLQSGSTPTTAVTIDTAQNVGVGVTPSAWGSGRPAIEMSSSVSAYIANNNTGPLQLQNNSYYNGSVNVAKVTGAGSAYQQYQGGHTWYSMASVSAGATQTFTQAMTLDTNGNLGLGVTPLTTWSGRSVLQIGSAGQMNYGSGTSNGGSMAYGNNGYWNGSADKAITTGYSQIVALNDNGTGRVIVVTTSGTSSAGATISYTAGPYVSAGNTSWTNSSDERLKNITGLITNGLESVNTLRAAKYTWKDDATNKPKVGLIAQDVQKVLPEAVETFNKYNSEDTTEYLGVTYTEVIPLLVAAIQELSAKVTALEAKVGG